MYTRATLPVVNYGGTERVIWDLVYALHLLGHKVTLLAGKGTQCEWAKVVEYQPDIPLQAQLPKEIDVVHFHSNFEELDVPYILTQHGNSDGPINPNTVFVSSQHARNHGGEAYVYNGLNWDNYLKPDLRTARERFHFLGKAAWRVKNVQGAINITKKAGQQLDVLGGHRLNLKMGFRLTLDRHVRFLGMVDDPTKSKIMTQSKGLVFPVTWHEPFGLALTESMYFGCPVFGTPYGSLPELVPANVGFLSAKESELVDAVANANQYSAAQCHEYAKELFNADVMARAYLEKYQKVVSGVVLNSSLGDVISEFKRLKYSKA
ncbi:glycosyltransferase [Vibrio amylolyticus]